MASPYQSRQAFQLKPAFYLLAVLLIGAALLTALWLAADPLGRVLLLYPVLAGASLGVVGAQVVKTLKIQHVASTVAIGIAASSLAMLAPHLVLHQLKNKSALQDLATLEEIVDSVGGEESRLREGESATVARERLRIESRTISTYFSEYFGFSARAQDGTSQTLGKWPGLLVFFAEILASILTALYFMHGQASEPSCCHCGQWLDEKTLARLAYGRTSSLVDGLCEKNLDAPEYTQIFRSPDTKESIHLVKASCPLQHASQVLRIWEERIVASSKRLRVRHCIDLQMDEEDWQELEKALTRVPGVLG